MKNKPITETGNIRFEFTIFGTKNLFVASPSRKIVMIQMLDNDTTVPIISALWYPNEFLVSAFFYAILSAMIDRVKPIKSEAK